MSGHPFSMIETKHFGHIRVFADAPFVPGEADAFVLAPPPDASSVLLVAIGARSYWRDVARKKARYPASWDQDFPDEEVHWCPNGCRIVINKIELADHQLRDNWITNEVTFAEGRILLNGTPP